jgi:hypothetical protein
MSSQFISRDNPWKWWRSAEPGGPLDLSAIDDASRARLNRPSNSCLGTGVDVGYWADEISGLSLTLYQFGESRR